jgi:integrase
MFRGKRDYAMVAVLLGCGLRRAELAALAVEHLQQREEHWVIADLVGKGGHVRTVPVPTWVKAAVDRWLTAAGINTAQLFGRSTRRVGLQPAVSVLRSSGAWSRPDARSAVSMESLPTICGAMPHTA